ncbi:SANTA domain-containing protein [Psidium guajava]|nr:SANTA domain-containing protein [Psidium guajava]
MNLDSPVLGDLRSGLRWVWRLLATSDLTPSAWAPSGLCSPSLDDPRSGLPSLGNAGSKVSEARRREVDGSQRRPTAVDGDRM